MALNEMDYLAQLQVLLPPGLAWPRDDDAQLTKLLQAAADELARVDGRVEDLFRQVDPLQVDEMLVDFERAFGLPDGCQSGDASPDERRRRLHQKMIWRGGQSAPYFIGLLDTLGYPGSTIDEFRGFKCNSKCNEGIYQGAWRYAWRVNVQQQTTVRRFNCRSPCNAPLMKWGDATLQCLLSTYKPAHTILLIAYVGDYS